MFLEFKAAYDGIDRIVLFKALKDFLVPRKLRCFVELTLNIVRCRVRTELNPL
jgi:hypothetical protein